MTADRWTQAVRQRLGLGRFLPLGHPRDGTWITEGAVDAVLRRAAADVPDIRVGTLRVALANPDEVYDPAVRPPPSALPPGPLRITAEFTAPTDPTAFDVEPLPITAARLRLALAEAATERLGLMVTEVDLHVVEPGDTHEPPTGVRRDTPRPAAVPTIPDEARVATAALSVPGVLDLTDALGHPVHISEIQDDEAALPRRHIRIELAVAATERTVDVARAVRATITEALTDAPTVAVLVTEVTEVL